ncbi:thioesterase family protein [Risungbinella massiliensis]|uniref:thioesterase family protein n=1 Tax=Risungbinella massiliensis TaxID=1329796 RepID=UPI0005CB9F61|nr:thioesterase [Risungbinella massiliensis]
MKPGLLPGMKQEITITVEESMRPAFDEVVIHDVMSTVSMIYQMERVGRKMLVPYLEPHEEGAGYALDVCHTGIAVIGQEVTITAICTEVSDRRLVCDVVARTVDNVVGEGTFTQAIFPKEKLTRKIAKFGMR